MGRVRWTEAKEAERVRIMAGLEVHDKEVEAWEVAWGERLVAFVLDMADRGFDVASRDYVEFLVAKDLAKARILATERESTRA